MAAQQCEFYDIHSAAGLSGALQRGLIRCIKKQCEHAVLVAAWGDLSAAVETRARQSVEAGAALPVLVAAIDTFVSKRLSSMRKLTSLFKSKNSHETDIEHMVVWMDKLLQEVKAKGADPKIDCNQKAVDLLRATKDPYAYCQVRSSTAEERDAHVAQCPLRAVSCPNTGCDVKTVLRKLPAHDQTCPFKLLPCPQNCKEQVCRKDLVEHTSTVCAMHPVTCPYSRLGCSIPLVLGTMEMHLENTDSHLRLAVVVIQEQTVELQGLQVTVARMQKMLETLQHDVGVSQAKDLAGVKKSVSKLQSHTSAVGKSNKKDIEQLRKEVKNLSKEVNASKVRG